MSIFLLLFKVIFFCFIFSGAHLNPSVTFAALLAGAVTPVKASLYMVAQMVGGLVGAGLTRVSFLHELLFYFVIIY